MAGEWAAVGESLASGELRVFEVGDAILEVGTLDIESSMHRALYARNERVFKKKKKEA